MQQRRKEMQVAESNREFVSKVTQATDVEYDYCDVPSTFTVVRRFV